MRKTLAYVLVLATAIPTVVVADDKPQLPRTTAAPHAASGIREALLAMEPGGHVVVRLRDNRIVHGRVERIGVSSFILANRDNKISTQVAFARVKQIHAMSGHERLALTALAIVGIVVLMALANRQG